MSSGALSKPLTGMPSGGPLLGLGLLGLDLRQRFAGSDGDAARLQLFGKLALQIYGEQTIHEARADDLHVVGKLEASLEGAGGNTAVQVLPILTAFIRLLTRNHEHVLFLRDGQVVLREAGNRHADAVVVLANLYNVVRRPVIDRRETARGFKRIEHSIICVFRTCAFAFCPKKYYNFRT